MQIDDVSLYEGARVRHALSHSILLFHASGGSP